jgi:segregation and condensation protein B
MPDIDDAEIQPEANAPGDDETPAAADSVTVRAPDADEDGVAPTPDYEQLARLLESLLFVAGEPAPIERLASALEQSPEDIELALLLLTERLQERGIRLQRHHHQVQLVTMPEAADVIEAYLGLDLTTKLSRAALETLAIIAYRQPITRPQIEAIRGVSSDGVIRTLLHRGLVQEMGRLETAGRPVLFGTTPDFLNYFGISSLEDLPPLEEDDMDALSERIAMMNAPAEDEEEAEAV